jgi:hypothetical protein
LVGNAEDVRHGFIIHRATLAGLPVVHVDVDR